MRDLFPRRRLIERIVWHASLDNRLCGDSKVRVDLLDAKKLGSITKAIEPLESRIRSRRDFYLGMLYTLVRKVSWLQVHLIVAKGASGRVFVVRPMGDRIFSKQCGHFISC